MMRALRWCGEVFAACLLAAIIYYACVSENHHYTGGTLGLLKDFCQTIAHLVVRFIDWAWPIAKGLINSLFH